MARFTIVIANTKAAKLRLAETTLDCHLRILDSIQDDDRDEKDWTITLDIPVGVDVEYVEMCLNPIIMHPQVDMMKQLMESK